MSSIRLSKIEEGYYEFDNPRKKSKKIRFKKKNKKLKKLNKQSDYRKKAKRKK
tara:strand:+ start:211 stop:369 length:159 start_codon:yes stop_codon:yes gene_type:complete